MGIFAPYLAINKVSVCLLPIPDGSQPSCVKRLPFSVVAGSLCMRVNARHAGAVFLMKDWGEMSGNEHYPVLPNFQNQAK